MSGMSLGAGNTVMNKAGSLPSRCLHFKEKGQEINSQTRGEVTGVTITMGVELQMGKVKDN